MDLIITAGGQIRCIYCEELPLHELGSPAISRASHVEPNEAGQWIVDLTPVAGPKLGPFLQRSAALAAEKSWLEAHWLVQSGA